MPPRPGSSLVEDAWEVVSASDGDPDAGRLTANRWTLYGVGALQFVTHRALATEPVDRSSPSQSGTASCRR